MKVLYVIPSVSLQRGGPSTMVETVTRGLVDAGCEVEVVTTDDDGRPRADVALNEPIDRDGVIYRYFRRDTHFYTVSAPLYRWLRKHSSRFDVIHTHAVFGFPTAAAGAAARRAGVPYVVKPMGTLNTWGVTHAHPLLKKVSLRLVEGRLLDRAAAVHFVTEHEKALASATWRGSQAVVIPTPVAPPGPGSGADFRARQGLGDEPVLLFLSRINESKGVEILLEAFAGFAATRSDVKLVMAGTGAPQLISRLKQIASKAGIAERVLWPGFLEGQHKRDALAGATAFVLPSYTESFGVAVVEAMAAGLPVLVSDGVGIHEEISEAGAGLVVRPEPEALLGGMLELFGSEDALAGFGANGARLASERFSSDAVISLMLQLYSELSGVPIPG